MFWAFIHGTYKCRYLQIAGWWNKIKYKTQITSNMYSSNKCFITCHMNTSIYLDDLVKNIGYCFITGRRPITSWREEICYWQFNSLDQKAHEQAK